jgi:hypothetical protein
MPPQTPQDYRDRADVCDALAARATSQDVRMSMHDMASAWRELADADEAKRQAAIPDRTPKEHPTDAGGQSRISGAHTIWDQLAEQASRMASEASDPESCRLIGEIAARYDALAKQSRTAEALTNKGC